MPRWKSENKEALAEALELGSAIEVVRVLNGLAEKWPDRYPELFGKVNRMINAEMARDAADPQHFSQFTTLLENLGRHHEIKIDPRIFEIAVNRVANDENAPKTIIRIALAVSRRNNPQDTESFQAVLRAMSPDLQARVKEQAEDRQGGHPYVSDEKVIAVLGFNVTPAKPSGPATSASANMPAGVGA